MFGICSWKHQPEDDGRVSLRDPSVRMAVKNTTKTYIFIILIMSCIHWFVGSMYYGVNYKRTDYVKNTDVKVIDLDGGYIGGNVTQLLLQTPPGDGQPTYVKHDGVGTVDEAKEFVRKHGWGAVVINPGLTERYTSAMMKGTEYVPEDAITAVYTTGRNAMVTLVYIEGSIAATIMKVNVKFSVGALSQFKQAAAAAGTRTITPNAAAVIHPIGYTVVDVAPFNYAIAIIAATFMFFVSLACIFAPMLGWKLSSFMLFLKIRYRDLAVFWVGVITTWVLIISCYASLAFLAYKGPDYNTLALEYTAGTFFKIWFTVFGVVLALAFWIYSLLLMVPPLYFGIVSLSHFIPNVASSIVPLETAPKFFRMFRVLPFYNGTMLIRTITSGAYPHVGQNIGILVGEVVFSFFVFLFAIWLRQRLVVMGIADIPGNIYGRPGFHSPVPYYKDVRRQLDEEAVFKGSIDGQATVADSERKLLQ
ncbi:hypothetical protein FBU59_001806 [Linderina macrospora]|uniref:Uncharacterized protein n=1 Tax=Linderina macrospora TaxID=4868 RepID=A0ACC1JCZ6_9FUNG|nr:hypothetical protein FBU59_001806 [Linderina macrospora]